MAAPLLIRRTVILAKVEGTYGVDAVPVATTDAIQVVEVTINPNTDVLDRKPLGQSLDALQPIIGKRFAEITVVVENKTNGNADSGLIADDVEFGPLLEACGFARTLNVGVSVQYDPVSEPQVSVTMEFFYDGIKFQSVGCVGSWEFTAAAGNFGQWTFTMMGLWENPTDVALPATPNIFTTQPPILQNANITFDGDAVCIQELTIGANNEMAERPCANSNFGLFGFFISDRDVQGTVDPEATLLADRDYWSEWADGDAVPITGLLGTATGQITDFSFPNAFWREIPLGERNAYRIHEAGFTAAANSVAGDDSVRFLFR